MLQYFLVLKRAGAKKDKQAARSRRGCRTLPAHRKTETEWGRSNGWRWKMEKSPEDNNHYLSVLRQRTRLQRRVVEKNERQQAQNSLTNIILLLLWNIIHPIIRRPTSTRLLMTRPSICCPQSHASHLIIRKQPYQLKPSQNIELNLFKPKQTYRTCHLLS